MFLEEQIKVNIIFQSPQYEPNLFDIKPKRPNEKQWESVTVQICQGGVLLGVKKHFRNI